MKQIFTAFILLLALQVFSHAQNRGQGVSKFPKDPTSQPKVDSIWDIEMVIMYGQSNADGIGGYPAIHKKPHPRHLGPSQGVIGTFTLLGHVAQLNESEVYPNRGETGGYALIDSINTTGQYLIFTSALAGASYEQIKKGGTYIHPGVPIVFPSGTTVWDAMLIEVQLAKDYADTNNLSIGCRMVWFVHGEAPAGETRNKYRSNLQDLQRDFDNDVKAITGQSEDVHLYLSQSSYNTTLGSFNTEIAIGQILADGDNGDKIHVVNPTYGLAPNVNSDKSHFTNVGHILNGTSAADAYSRVEGVGSYSALKPVTAHADIPNGEIVITMTGVINELTLDTRIEPVTDFGFKVYDTLNAPVSISSVIISGYDIIISVPSLSSEARVRYALDYEFPSDWLNHAGAGNLFDGLSASDVERWCPSFEISTADTNIEPDGYFASPSGSVSASGSFNDPWDLRAALNRTTTTATLPDNGTLNLLNGVYDSPLPGTTGANLLRYYSVNIPGITIKPYNRPSTSDPSPVIVRGGFQLNEINQTLLNIVTENIDPVPLGEPTPPNSIWPNYPSPYPPFTDTSGTVVEWGASGVQTGAGASNISILNVMAIGGYDGFSAFGLGPVTFYGNIAYGNGWKATDRNHGHCTYFQNDSSDPSGRFIARHNLMSTHPKGRTGTGSLALLAYGTAPEITNFTFSENGSKGDNLIQSVGQRVYDVEFSDNYVESTIYSPLNTGPNGGTAVGRPGRPDDLIVFNDNTFINHNKRVQNNTPITNVFESGTRMFKTSSDWYATIIDDDGIPPIELGTFYDITDGSKSDEFVVYPNEVESNRAHIIVFDANLDGSVSVDLSSWADSGDRVVIFHYRSITSKLSSVDTYYSGPITLPVVDDPNDRTDFYVAFKSNP